MSNDEYKVRVEVDGVVYRGRRSVHQKGEHVWIDGKLVGVEVDNDGNLLVDLPVPKESLPLARTIRHRWWWPW